MLCFFSFQFHFQNILEPKGWWHREWNGIEMGEWVSENEKGNRPIVVCCSFPLILCCVLFSLLGSSSTQKNFNFYDYSSSMIPSLYTIFMLENQKNSLLGFFFCYYSFALIVFAFLHNKEWILFIFKRDSHFLTLTRIYKCSMLVSLSQQLEVDDSLRDSRFFLCFYFSFSWMILLVLCCSFHVAFAKT